jgi:hypothetical protein
MRLSNDNGVTFGPLSRLLLRLASNGIIGGEVQSVVRDKVKQKVWIRQDVSKLITCCDHRRFPCVMRIYNIHCVVSAGL